MKKIKANLKTGRKTGKTLSTIIYDVLQGRRFDHIAKENEDIYSAWCLRIAETIEIRLEDENLI